MPVVSELRWAPRAGCGLLIRSAPPAPPPPVRPRAQLQRELTRRLRVPETWFSPQVDAGLRNVGFRKFCGWSSGIRWVTAGELSPGFLVDNEAGEDNAAAQQARRLTIYSAGTSARVGLLPLLPSQNANGPMHRSGPCRVWHFCPARLPTLFWQSVTNDNIPNNRHLRSKGFAALARLYHSARLAQSDCSASADSDAADTGDLAHRAPRVACVQPVQQRFGDSRPPVPPLGNMSSAPKGLKTGQGVLEAACCASPIRNPGLQSPDRPNSSNSCSKQKHQSWSGVAPRPGCATHLPDEASVPTLPIQS
ncbi:predicted protein [Chaetomium globosum CBS 148.51]|uniref:Uncharacterized protein n=1 Tax=Chaetomium globosum (strain ATCC 6205 / CBS 148.51 / DSM 1962 / NBRC 6347 / NRRL 1970) TaxID=306901 RepID=Q2GNZ8_CHAGB|nr:uncharacterized protein CHGG_10306 [Chaetomium globosum CBS 148.51]EAQ83902.1 predicted protein [Chaetomium globosum CBS 148.51]